VPLVNPDAEHIWVSRALAALRWCGNCAEQRRMNALLPLDDG
jgi:hypothetical protein